MPTRRSELGTSAEWAIGAISPRTRPREGTRPKPVLDRRGDREAGACREDRRRAQRSQYAPTEHL